MLSIWKEYGFEILFWVSVVVLLFMLVVNITIGKKGTYEDHSALIWDLLNKPTTVSHVKHKFSGVSLPSSTHHGGVSPSSTHYGDHHPRKHISESRGELECRRVAEKYTGRKFSKARPEFLRNAITGSKLELDCFNEELMVAIEYNGEQHYNYTPHFHKSKDAFYNIKYRDSIKKKLCEDNGVKLIIVPYTVKDIKEYLYNELEKIIKN